MFEFARYEGRKRLRGSIALSVALSALAAFAVWVFPSYSRAFEGADIYEAFPEPIIRAFDIRAMESIEGFLAVELYVFGWVLLLGLYAAYSAASLVADDIDRGRMDTLLAMPVSRPRLLAEKFLALAVPILAVNVLTPIVVAISVVLIGESIAVADLVALHALSIPYLFACAGIGLVVSVATDRAGVAQRVALGATFGLYLIESLLTETEYELLGAVAPMRYFDPSSTLIDGSYDIAGALVLTVMTLLLVALAGVWFVSRDI